MFTKFLVFDRTRLFLKGQAEVQLDDWLDLASFQAIDKIKLNHRPDRFLMMWKNDTLMIHEGDFTLPKPINKQDYIHTFDDHNWVIAENCLGEACVTVGIKDTQRKMLVRKLVALLYIPLLLVFILTMLAIYLAVTSALNPLKKLATVVSDTSPDKLGVLPEANQSSELKPLVIALNQLIENMRLQLQSERQFLDTCTHELRTPITALVANIQSIEYVDVPAKSRLSQIQQSALRTARVANQFLVYARNRNAEATATEETTFDLCELIRQVSAEHMSENPQLLCRMQGEPCLMITADNFAVELAIRNIIENSIKYGVNPATDTVDLLITVGLNESTTTLTFEDAGSGVEPEYLKKILERFYRVPTKDTPGAGLGLTIVQETAHRYGGAVTIEQGDLLGGLKVSISLQAHNQRLVA